MRDNVLHEEATFHDQWAASEDVDKVKTIESFEGAAAVENRFILTLLGDLTNKTVLDVGCGLGESSVYFALKGAQVTATDLSPDMLKFTEALAERHGTKLKTALLDGGTLPFADNSFDVIYLANVIHHIPDRKLIYSEMNRVLKPGGMFCSIDPIAYNPVINVYRRLATEVRTIDESPLTTKDFADIKAVFPDAQHRQFWLLTLILFVKYFLIDRVHPNQDRYWKRILDQSTFSLWWWTPLERLDRILLRIPLLNWLAWNIVIWGTKQQQR